MKTKFNFTITGFIIGIVLVSLFASSTAIFLSELKVNQNITTDTSLDDFDMTDDLISLTEQISESTDIKQEAGILDVIGGYFSAGYGALKTTLRSFSIFEALTEEASQAHPVMAFFMQYIKSIVLIALFVGVLITVLVKMKI